MNHKDTEDSELTPLCDLCDSVVQRVRKVVKGELVAIEVIVTIRRDAE
jgi:hypothetical protein